MKAFDFTDPEAEEFEFFDSNTLMWVAIVWCSLLLGLFVMYLLDKMTEGILNVLPKDWPETPNSHGE